MKHDIKQISVKVDFLPVDEGYLHFINTTQDNISEFCANIIASTDERFSAGMISGYWTHYHVSSLMLRHQYG